MSYPDDDTGAVLQEMKDAGFDFSTPTPVDFYALFESVEQADVVAQLYAADHLTGDLYTRIETQVSETGNVELVVAKEMLVTYSNITNFEKGFTARCEKHNGYADGWGVAQEE